MEVDLINSSMRGNYEAVKRLLEKGAVVNWQNEKGWSALMQASCRGHDKIVGLLLKKGASVDLLNCVDDISLMLATRRGHYEVAQLNLKWDDLKWDDFPQFEVARLLLEVPYFVKTWPDLMDFCGWGHRQPAIAVLQRNLSLMNDTPGWSALMKASGNGHCNVVKILIKKGANVDLQDYGGSSVLMHASEAGHYEVVKLLLEKGRAKVDLQDSDGWSALMYACRGGSCKVAKIFGKGTHSNAILRQLAVEESRLANFLEVVQILLRKGAQVDLQDSDGWSALMHATVGANVEALKLLCHGDVDLQDKDGWSSLMHATQEGLCEIVEFLLERGAHVDHLSHKGKQYLLQKNDDHYLCQKRVRSALMIACVNGSYTLAKILLGNGAKVDLQDNDGWSPLMCACQEGHYEVAKLLLAKGARFDLQSKTGLSALMCTCLVGEGQLQIFQHTGAIPNSICFFQSLLLSKPWNGNYAVAKLLLEKGALVDLQDETGMSALMFAAKVGDFKMSAFFLENGAHIELQVHSAFLHACKEGHYYVANLLIRCGAQLDFQDVSGMSALMYALRQGHYYIAELLLIDGGAQLDLQDVNGMSALMHTCRDGLFYAVVLLLAGGAELDLQDKLGQSALMHACSCGHYEIASLLIDSGARLDLLDKSDKSVITGEEYVRHFSVLEYTSFHHINFQDGNGLSALMLACQGGSLEVAKLLLQKGAVVNLQDTSGLSALMFACQKEHSDLVKLLLDYGADVNLQSFKNWESAYGISMVLNNPEIASLVEEKSAEVESHSGAFIVATPRTCSSESSASFMQDKPIHDGLAPECSEESYEDIPLSLNTLTLLKWNDTSGQQHKFYLINKVSAKWRIFGFRFGREENEMEGLEDQYRGKASHCWCRVMSQWLEDGGTDDYPATWRGALTLLEDVDCWEVARELERVLAMVTPPLPPPLLNQVLPTANSTPVFEQTLLTFSDPLPEPALVPSQPGIMPPSEHPSTPPSEPAVTPTPEPALTPPTDSTLQACCDSNSQACFDSTHELAVTPPSKPAVTPPSEPAVTPPSEPAVTPPPKPTLTSPPEPAVTSPTPLPETFSQDLPLMTLSRHLIRILFQICTYIKYCATIPFKILSWIFRFISALLQYI